MTKRRLLTILFTTLLLTAGSTPSKTLTKTPTTEAD
jgi:uncharacterized lipoprotein YajG